MPGCAARICVILVQHYLCAGVGRRCTLCGAFAANSNTHLLRRRKLNQTGSRGPCTSRRALMESCCWSRPLCAAVAAAGRGRFTLDGVPRMRERPIGDLVDGLRQLGVDAECPLGTGCPPVVIDARGLPTGTVRPTPSRLAGSLSQEFAGRPLPQGPGCACGAERRASGTRGSNRATALLFVQRCGRFVTGDVVGSRDNRLMTGCRLTSAAQ